MASDEGAWGDGSVDVEEETCSSATCEVPDSKPKTVAVCRNQKNTVARMRKINYILYVPEGVDADSLSPYGDYTCGYQAANVDIELAATKTYVMDQDGAYNADNWLQYAGQDKADTPKAKRPAVRVYLVTGYVNYKANVGGITISEEGGHATPLIGLRITESSDSDTTYYYSHYQLAHEIGHALGAVPKKNQVRGTHCPVGPRGDQPGCLMYWSIKGYERDAAFCDDCLKSLTGKNLAQTALKWKYP